MLEMTGSRVLRALMALEEALAAEGGGRVTVTLPEQVGLAARQSLAREADGKPAGSHPPQAKSPSIIRSGFRCGSIMVLWASSTGARKLAPGSV